MLRSSRRAVVIAALTLLVLVGALAHEPCAYGQTAARSAIGPRVVLVTYRGTDDLLERTVQELLARRDLETVPDSQERVVGSRLLVRVSVERGADGTRVRVRSAETNAPDVLDRVVPHDASPAIERERIALAIRGAAEAALVMEEERRTAPAASPESPTAPPMPAPAAPTAPAPTATAPAPTAPAPTAPEQTAPTPAPSPGIASEQTAPDRVARSGPGPRALALDIATFAGAGLVGDGVDPVARVGGAISVGRRSGLRPSVALGALYAFPFDAGHGSVVAHGHLVSTRLLPSIEPVHCSRFGLAFGLGGGLDVLTVDASSDTLPASSLAEPTTRVDPILSGAATARVGIASDVVLTLTLLGDVDLADRRYLFENRGTRSAVLDAWRVRPMLLVGLSFTAVGPRPFGGPR